MFDGPRAVLPVPPGDDFAVQLLFGSHGVRCGLPALGHHAAIAARAGPCTPRSAQRPAGGRGRGRALPPPRPARASPAQPRRSAPRPPAATRARPAQPTPAPDRRAATSGRPPRLEPPPGGRGQPRPAARAPRRPPGGRSGRAPAAGAALGLSQAGRRGAGRLLERMGGTQAGFKQQKHVHKRLFWGFGNYFGGKALRVVDLTSQEREQRGGRMLCAAALGLRGLGLPLDAALMW